MVTFLLVWSLLVLQRLEEVRRARRHTRQLLDQGAVEYAPHHYPIMVALHSFWFCAWGAEVWATGARLNLAWLPLALAGQILRLWAQHTLGPRWTTRILIVPGESPVEGGPFRYLRHPNYLGVVLEILAFPMLFGAWRSALACSLGNGLLLGWRIGQEEAAWTKFGN